MIGAILWIGGIFLIVIGAALLYQNIIVQLHRAVGA